MRPSGADQASCKPSKASVCRYDASLAMRGPPGELLAGERARADDA
jgi:hypothetical protein